MAKEKKLIEAATYEAIYWWNRLEGYNHRSFSIFDEVYRDKKLLRFFTNKIFNEFLRDYSLRRTLPAGNDSVYTYIDKLFKHKFIEGAREGDIEIVDTVSNKIEKEDGKYDFRHTKSLLGKLAFFINPNSYYLYDNRAKKTIYEYYRGTEEKKTYKELGNYKCFVEQNNRLKADISNKKLFGYSHGILENFKDTDAFMFFKKNEKAFEMRIVDKYLWLNQNQDKELHNEKYIDFKDRLGLIEN